MAPFEIHRLHSAVVEARSCSNVELNASGESARAASRSPRTIDSSPRTARRTLTFPVAIPVRYFEAVRSLDTASAPICFPIAVPTSVEFR